MEKYTLTLSCRDRSGIVAAVTGCLASCNCFIHESAQYGDPDTESFFMRAVFSPEEKGPPIEEVKRAFLPVAEEMGMEWEIERSGYRPRLLILASKTSHCLNAILNKQAMGTLAVEVPAVASNHPDLEEMCSWYKIPFHHLPVTAETKEQQEAKILELVSELKVDLVVLARYMQILSPEMTERLNGKAINIHHSFLPSFKGARPYHQAHTRGVKLIGATAHFVTDELDEGPIIEQEVTRVNHTQTATELVDTGHDVESLVLTRALKLHSERRLFLNGSKTVIFR